METQIRTHTYWMTYKEYKKWSKTPKSTVLNNDKIRTRIHIIFE
jgi:hypothetical protein